MSLLIFFLFTTSNFFLYAIYMPRRKSHHRHKRRNVVDYRVRTKAIFFAVIFIIVIAFFLNPKPADLTLDNVYRKFSHSMLHEESEYVTDEYVNDIHSQDGTFQPAPLAAIFENTPVSKGGPLAAESIATVLPANIEKHILAATDDSKWIEVDLSDQRLYAWENGNKVFEFTISSGKPWTPTLKGEFRIWIKLRYANMKGGSKQRGDYYFLPNVPYVMYYDRGYGIHGTYWHNNFGQVMSHGCVNLTIDDSGKLFDWVGPSLNGKSVAKSTAENPGTRVIVHD